MVPKVLLYWSSQKHFTENHFTSFFMTQNAGLHVRLESLNIYRGVFQSVVLGLSTSESCALPEYKRRHRAIPNLLKHSTEEWRGGVYFQSAAQGTPSTQEHWSTRNLVSTISNALAKTLSTLCFQQNNFY